MNQLFPQSRQLFATKQLSWPADDFRAAFLLGTYSFRSSDKFVSDLAAYIAQRSDPVASRTAVDGFCSAAAIQLPTLISGLSIGSVVIFHDTGVDSTSSLVAFYDDMTGLPFVSEEKAYELLPDVAFGGFFRL